MLNCRCVESPLADCRKTKRLILDYLCSLWQIFHCKTIAQLPKNKPKCLDIWLSVCTWICVSKYFAAIKMSDIIKNFTACRNLKFDLHTTLSSKNQICPNFNRFSGCIIQENSLSEKKYIYINSIWSIRIHILSSSPSLWLKNRLDNSRRTSQKLI